MRQRTQRLLRAGGVLGTLLLLAALGPFLSFQAGCVPGFAGLPPAADSGLEPAVQARVQEAQESLESYRQDEESTYLTFPEWYIVYSADEYGSFLKEGRPSGFPYFSSIGQFWRAYGCVHEITQGRYPFNAPRYGMLAVIGTSYSVEYAVKGAYESTIGRAAELLSGGTQTQEDIYAQRVAEEYGAFLHTVAWYEFPFGQKLRGLWQETDLWGPAAARKWERKIVLSAEYAAKAAYASLLKLATQATPASPPPRIYLFAETIPAAVLAAQPEITIVRQVTAAVQLIELPRYEAFTAAVTALARHNVRLLEIAGNDEILVTAIVPAAWSGESGLGDTLFRMPLLTRPGQQRLGLRVQVSSLHTTIAALEAAGADIEHLYDY